MATTDKNTATAEPSGGTVGGRGVKLVGESVLTPGASLLLDGQMGSGAAHAVGGMAAAWLAGPLGWILVGANSYCKSVSGENLVGYFKKKD